MLASSYDTDYCTTTLQRLSCSMLFQPQGFDGSAFTVYLEIAARRLQHLLLRVADGFSNMPAVQKASRCKSTGNPEVV